MMIGETAKSSLIFAGGLAIGSVITWLCVRNHYRSEKEEEIASVKEVYAKRFDSINKEAIEKAAIATNKPDISVYTQALEQAKEKFQYSEQTDLEEVKEDYTYKPEVKQEFNERTSNLYEITLSEFSSFSNDRTRVTVTRFADDVFADEMYEQIDPEEYLAGDLITLNDTKPVKCLDYIRRMAQDEICIRNFDLGLDIDVVTEPRTYSDYTAV